MTPVPSSGVPLGLFCSVRYQVGRFELSPGDRLVLFTDGLTESVDRGEQEYGTDPDAFDRLEAATAEGQPISLPVDPDPLMRITSLDRAVIRIFGRDSGPVQ